MNQEDYIVRAMGADRQLRLFAVTSRNLVERAREQKLDPVIGRDSEIRKTADSRCYDGQYDERR